MNELALFAGTGGGILGGQLLGWETVCAVEIEAYPREVLLQRQRDGVLPLFPIWDDIKTFDGKPWSGKVDIITAGPPCQPFSTEGKRKQEDDERNLFPQTIRVIQEVKPSFVLLENVPGIQQFLPVVIRDLRRIGYTVNHPIVVSAASTGALHTRKRIWLYAYSGGIGWKRGRVRRTPGKKRIKKKGMQTWFEFKRLVSQVLQNAVPTRNGRRIHDGFTNRVDRLKAIGNGQVPAVVELAWKTLKEFEL